MKKEKSCGAIISNVIDGKLKILLIKHRNGGHWAFPKGHVEKGETEVQTATREIREETGLVTTVDDSFRHVVTYSPYKGSIKDVVYFSAKVVEGVQHAQPEEVMEIIWLEPDEAIRTVTFDNDKEVLRKYMDHIIG